MSPEAPGAPAPALGGPRPGPVVHHSFSVTLELAAAPGEVFSAYSELARRRRWFRLPGDGTGREHELDFRLGGGERARSTFAVAQLAERLEYRSRFLDIVAGSRIVCVYEFSLDDRTKWISLVTVEFAALGRKTLLSHTEQCAFVAPGADPAADIATSRAARACR